VIALLFRRWPRAASLVLLVSLLAIVWRTVTPRDQVADCHAESVASSTDTGC